MGVNMYNIFIYKVAKTINTSNINNMLYIKRKTCSKLKTLISGDGRQIRRKKEIGKLFNNIKSNIMNQYLLPKCIKRLLQKYRGENVYL